MSREPLSDHPSPDGPPSSDPLPDDPPPQPPLRPEPDDCCRSGCDPCVFDLYSDELARYEAALRAWRQRHGQTPAT